MMSILPNASIALCTSSSGALGFVRSPAYTAVSPAISSAACFATSPSRSLMSTLAPCAASSSAVARPMPRAEPVTMAALPSSTPMVYVAPFAFSESGGYPSRARGGAARGVADDDGAEVLGVQRAGLPFGERGGGPRLDADSSFAEGAVEDVGAVSGGGHPGAHDRLRRGQPQRAPGDVLADHIPCLGVGEVAVRAHPVQRRLAAGRDVGEVVFVGHVAAVLLSGARQPRVCRERALAASFAFLIDQAQHRRADLREVAGAGGEVGVGAGTRGERGGGPAQVERRERPQPADARGTAGSDRRGRVKAGRECEQSW